MNYYNEFDKFAANWLRNLIDAELIPPGHVDGRDIKEVTPDDLKGYTQHHFFAGIGGWPLALQYAGWPTTRPVWTASCPCQPLSCAGKGKGADDERHLWPELYRLASQHRPVTVFGEQVASSDGLEWFDGVSLDLEEIGFAVGAADLPAASVGAPHIRQRLFWVANAKSQQGTAGGVQAERGRPTGEPRGDSSDSRLADADSEQRGLSILERGPQQEGIEAIGSGEDSGLGDTISQGLEGHTGHELNRNQPGRQHAESVRPTTPPSWNNSQPIGCGDNKARRIEPGISPLAHGIPGRVGLLKGYGNAIVPQVAAKFVRAFMACTRDK